MKCAAIAGLVVVMTAAQASASPEDAAVTASIYAEAMRAYAGSQIADCNDYYWGMMGVIQLAEGDWDRDRGYAAYDDGVAALAANNLDAAWQCLSLAVSDFRNAESHYLQAYTLFWYGR